ncbi:MULTISPECIES: DUF2271 domain-containing protein [Thalassolituus]|uniref:DUF2271 domain-containing protein n=1 Tax=Thalassolituus TaxID=187492 RepID=UPI000C362E6D|nr:MULTISPECIES: DUF2271 domain-containing protein [Thalassolituus]MAX85531.1 hypothetical protein [Oceanospirillaceae bacterium]|tara:strand:+ start:3087 stop:3608 length:522 start_codon:yes stop_codon:yes gene_type:complete
MKLIKSGLMTAVAFASFTQAHAADFSVSVEIPKLDVAEYHKPYVAVWIEDNRNQVVSNLAVWYDVDMRNAEGEKWLKDMRQWWRRSGRSLEMPVDGVSGATYGPGAHDLEFTVGESPLADLQPGDYRLRVEAAREVGGRELINIPFSWPQSSEVTFEEQGSSELGAIELTIKP